ncbi:MAG: FemAB family XrtA/PEP-CTERM system-associated protein [Nitrospira sp.]|jgi:FemAB-related protein (PEP-CTERM system-associated)
MRVTRLVSENKVWDEFVRGAQGGSIFHTTKWKRVIERVFGFHSHYLAVSDGDRMVGCLPLFFVKNLIAGRALLSVPFGVEGGICASTDEASQLLFAEARTLADDLRADYVEFRHAHHSPLSLPLKELYVTFERELFPDLDKNMEAIPRKQRRMVRQGEKAGLRSTLEGIEGLNGFYDIYAESVRNLGTPVFPYRYFEAVMEELAAEAKILTVWYEGIRVGAVLTFFYGDRVMPFYGGALKAYRAHAVNDFMYWALMRLGCERGYRLFDFGRSKVGTGAYDFKRHWGFEPRPLPYQYYLRQGASLPNVSPTNAKLKPFIEIWKRLPLGITNLVGPRIIKYFP